MLAVIVAVTVHLSAKGKIVSTAQVVAEQNGQLLSALNQVKPGGQAELDQALALLRQHISWLNEMWAVAKSQNPVLGEALAKQRTYFEQLLAYATGVVQVTSRLNAPATDAVNADVKLASITGGRAHSMIDQVQIQQIQQKVVDVVAAAQPKPVVVASSTGSGPTLDVSSLPPAEQAYMAQIMPLIQRYDRLRSSADFQKRAIDPVKFGTGSYDRDAIERAFYERRSIKDELLNIGYPPARFADAHQQFYEIVTRSLQAIQFLADYKYSDFKRLSDQNSSQWARVKSAYGL